jgi:hypothetical protein
MTSCPPVHRRQGIESLVPIAGKTSPIAYNILRRSFRQDVDGHIPLEPKLQETHTQRNSADENTGLRIELTTRAWGGSTRRSGRWGRIGCKKELNVACEWMDACQSSSKGSTAPFHWASGVERPFTSFRMTESIPLPGLGAFPKVWSQGFLFTGLVLYAIHTCRQSQENSHGTFRRR